ncbi:hypothetical protein ATO13_19595 [Stappia sp. 22II-S9-Z10]|nr:hypothetical protein ATO13_19595 [Stappia sp. 22II-S9-Z10]
METGRSAEADAIATFDSDVVLLASASPRMHATLPGGAARLRTDRLPLSCTPPTTRPIRACPLR